MIIVCNFGLHFPVVLYKMEHEVLIKPGCVSKYVVFIISQYKVWH